MGLNGTHRGAGQRMALALCQQEGAPGLCRLLPQSRSLQGTTGSGFSQCSQDMKEDRTRKSHAPHTHFFQHRRKTSKSCYRHPLCRKETKSRIIQVRAELGVRGRAWTDRTLLPGFRSHRTLGMLSQVPDDGVAVPSWWS